MLKAKINAIDWPIKPNKGPTLKQLNHELTQVNGRTARHNKAIKNLTNDVDEIDGKIKELNDQRTTALQEIKEWTTQLHEVEQTAADLMK